MAGQWDTSIGHSNIDHQLNLRNVTQSRTSSQLISSCNGGMRLDRTCRCHSFWLDRCNEPVNWKDIVMKNLMGGLSNCREGPAVIFCKSSDWRLHTTWPICVFDVCWMLNQGHQRWIQAGERLGSYLPPLYWSQNLYHLVAFSLIKRIQFIICICDKLRWG